ncbi:gfo/Idh/MocA family oxidoreductase [Mariniphaga sediminis]|jgi:predicted dehydrogenase|uniref:Gfo/Idh/MocA family oxidoreductase n=1 Tax=Mariniphaga sediminis TaxID=1628158 RepID=A0A399D0M7_9BACT|nr:Gfo/Idh/MocA family oxidoreductase [Mariniphaga sediminis]RIH64282.1 gfo/Idh/MocA family oxidoreductase [Mariniphaga sediminis]RIH66561.1 gfo/Idh/MocA family oxidoreductase [Mariniphaga sediminis]
MKRRDFLTTTAGATAGVSMLSSPVGAAVSAGSKKRVVLVGTGIRGVGFWGKRIVDNYSDIVEFVGLCDINPGRLEFAKKYMGVKCPVYSDFDKMVLETKPDLVIVTTVDATHHEYIVRAMELGVDVLTEKPMTTDENKCQVIIDAEKRTGRKCTVGFNYRYGTLFTAIKEQLAKKPVGEITSVDFNWYLNIYHGASYFRRWHGERDKGGSLFVHKSTHHFDLLNWLIDSDPVEVTAYGALEHYGKNHPFRGANCRNCAYTDKCDYYWDITKDKHSMDLYVKNEKYDGYIRDNCLWREDIDIFDKMSAQIKYANNVVVNYSLTTYSPYEGWRISFNGKDGRIESWEDIPWRRQDKINQSQLHAAEMNQSGKGEVRYDEIFVMKNFDPDYQMVKVEASKGGHGGGDQRLQDKIFRDPNMADPYKHSAGTRDGAMSCLIGIAARKSIDQQRPVKIEELTDIKPHPTRGA